MSTANERRALWFLAAVALSGSVVRLARSRTAESPADPGLGRQLARVDSVRAERAPRPKTRSRSPRPATPTPKAEAEPVDLNVATAQQIEGLPGIGPALSERIVAARDSLHGFSDVSGLCGVRGVGPALLHRLRPLATLSGAMWAADAACREPPRAALKSRAARRSKPR